MNSSSHHRSADPMLTEPFRIEIEPDEDAWHAYAPALVAYGGATWGKTREEALQNIRQVIEMVVADICELNDGEFVGSTRHHDALKDTRAPSLAPDAKENRRKPAQA